MKKSIFLFAFVVFTTIVSAQTNSRSRYQRGYYKPSSGTYVQPHFKTNTNRTNIDNYSTKDNSNIYTGTSDSRVKDYSPEANNYGSGKRISTGSKGGQYYFNSNGNKTYVPKRRS